MLAFERRFAALVEGYVAWLQRRAADGWRWQASEQPQQVQVALADGRSIELGGRLDRVDVTADGALGVIDYKARDAQALRKALRTAGEDIQLPFYGLLLPQRPVQAEYLSFERPRDDDGGVCAVAPPAPLETLMVAVDARLRRDLERIAAGAALPAIGSDAVCGRCEMRGLCRRDDWNPQPAAEAA
jgi:ATP-dependent helicase/nuclease subunit B